MLCDALPEALGEERWDGVAYLSSLRVQVSRQHKVRGQGLQMGSLADADRAILFGVSKPPI